MGNVVFSQKPESSSIITVIRIFSLQLIYNDNSHTHLFRGVSLTSPMRLEHSFLQRILWWEYIKKDLPGLFREHSLGTKHWLPTDSLIPQYPGRKPCLLNWQMGLWQAVDLSLALSSCSGGDFISMVTHPRTLDINKYSAIVVTSCDPPESFIKSIVWLWSSGCLIMVHPS